MQMIAGGATLLIVSLIAGEPSALKAAAITEKSVFALVYLIVFGSIIAFTVFTWLVTVSSSSQVSTYAYVNPVVAVFFRWGVAGGQNGARTIAATVVIFGSSALVSGERKKHPRPPGDTDLGGGEEATG